MFKGVNPTKKRLLIIGIFVILSCVGLSGCAEVNEPKNLEQLSITSFEVEPNIIKQGETANLTWIVMGSTFVNINNGVGNVSSIGKRVITPNETATYMLTAKNSTTTATATTQIIVTKTNNTNDTKENGKNTSENQRYTLTIEIIGSGHVVKYPNQVTYVYDAIVDLMANPDYNWKFIGWSGDITNNSNSVTIIMRNNNTITATFEEIPPEQHKVSGILYINDIPAPEGAEVRLYNVATCFTDTTGHYQLDFEANEGIQTFQVFWNGMWQSPTEVMIQSGVYEVEVDLHI